MIYIKENTIFIPRSCKKIGQTVEFENLTTKETYTYDIVSEVSAFHYKSIVEKDEMTKGQYSYKVKNENDEIIESGVAQVGEFSSNNTQYNIGKTTYRYYNYE